MTVLMLLVEEARATQRRQALVLAEGQSSDHFARVRESIVRRSHRKHRSVDWICRARRTAVGKVDLLVRDARQEVGRRITREFPFTYLTAGLVPLLRPLNPGSIKARCVETANFMSVLMLLKEEACAPESIRALILAIGHSSIQFSSICLSVVQSPHRVSRSVDWVGGTRRTAVRKVDLLIRDAHQEIRRGVA